MATLRIGIIGTGGMANGHAHRFGGQRGVRVAACLDLEAERARDFALRHGIPLVAGSLDELLDAVDAVSVVTSDASHAELTLAALAAGKHVFCEKPLTVTLDEARRVARAYRRARKRDGRVGMVNFSHRAGHFELARRLVAEGAIGEPRLVRSRYLQGWLATPVEATPARRLWRLQQAAGSMGVLGDLGCHLLDFTTGVCGRPRRLRCTLRTHAKLDGAGRRVRRAGGMALDANDSALIELDLSGDAYGIAQTTRWATGCGNEVELAVHGTAGAIVLGHGPREPHLRIVRSSGRGAGVWRERKPTRRADNWQRFVRAIKRAEEPEPDLLRGAEIQAMQDACFRSAEGGDWEGIGLGAGS